MTYRISRSQRETAFLEVATRLYAQLEDWYDQHPTASFAEFEVEARRVRQELMGHALALVITGRDTGDRIEPPKCPQCGQSMQFVSYRPWGVASQTSQIYGRPVTSVVAAKSRHFFILNRRRQRRLDRWRDAAARVAEHRRWNHGLPDGARSHTGASGQLWVRRCLRSA